jgi:maleate cis-trans isomerase
MPDIRVGFLYPGYSAEDDYPLAEGLIRPRAELRLVHTTMGEDAHRLDALLDMGSEERLRAGAEELRPAHVDSVVWACTSGSFVFGLEGARAQARRVGDLLAVPATSTSLAFLDALDALRIRRVAVAATYPQDIADSFRRFLNAGGIEVLRTGAGGIVTAVEVGRLSGQDVRAFAAANDDPDAEALLMPDTALHTIATVAQLEGDLGKTVLTANQVTIWAGLRLAGFAVPQAGLGRLFRVPAAVTPA